MKSIKIFVVLLAAMCLLGSCDFCRSIVGKPTSKEIEQIKREMMVREQQQALRNSENVAEKQAVAERARMEAEIAKNTLTKEYYVVLGSFQVPENATRFKEYLVKKGYDIQEVHFKNGYNVLMTCGSDNYNEVHKKMEEIMELQFCPEDIWIYDKSQNLHENK